ncbi:MAG: efflux RND transporter periplasmic adaptor subunit [Bryobacteraceae bacterium]
MRLLSFLLPAVLAAQALEVVPVVQQTISRKARIPGELYPFLKVPLQARVPGFVEAIDVDRGSAVKQGQTLVKLSAPEMAAQIAEAESKVLAVQSQKAESEAKLAAAEATYSRLKDASAVPGVVAALEVVQAEKAVDAIKAQLKALDASAEAARAAVKPLREMQSYLEVKAPFDGIVTDRFAHPGALVGPASAAPLVVLEQQSRLRLVLAVPEADAGAVARGVQVPFRVPAYPGQSFTGVVARLPNTVDPKTRTMFVELDAANPRGALAPGLYVEADWPIRRTKPSLLVPPTAVVTTTERSFVVRVVGGRAEWVNVSRGAVSGDLVEVMGSLEPGDMVVRRATDEIRNGSAVQVKPAAGK